MAAPWPSQLQKVFNADTFRETLPDNVIRSDVDVGPQKLRRRTTSAVTPITAGIFLPIEHYQTLKDFYEVDCAGGVLPFELEHPITGDLEEFRFRAPPDLSPLNRSGIYYVINLQLEMMP